jgi:hypothetical protein
MLEENIMNVIDIFTLPLFSAFTFFLYKEMKIK